MVGSYSSCSGSGLCRGTDSIPGLAQWVKGSSVAATVAQIQSLAWGLPYVMGAAMKKKKKERERLN